MSLVPYFLYHSEENIVLTSTTINIYRLCIRFKLFEKEKRKDYAYFMLNTVYVTQKSVHFNTDIWIEMVSLSQRPP